MMNAAIIQILLACVPAFADPPSVNLVSVRVTVGTKTLTGYSDYWDVDQYEHKGPVDDAAIESFLRKRTITIYPSNLDIVEHPSRFTYIYVGPKREIAPKAAGSISIQKGPRDGHVAYDYPFYQVSKREAAKLHEKPFYQCRQDGPSASIIWLSYNPDVGEKQLTRLCSVKTKPGLISNKSGKHSHFRDVYWFSYSVGDDD